MVTLPSLKNIHNNFITVCAFRLWSAMKRLSCRLNCKSKFTFDSKMEVLNPFMFLGLLRNTPCLLWEGVCHRGRLRPGQESRRMGRTAPAYPPGGKDWRRCGRPALRGGLKIWRRGNHRGTRRGSCRILSVFLNQKSQPGGMIPCNKSNIFLTNMYIFFPWKDIFWEKTHMI